MSLLISGCLVALKKEWSVSSRIQLQFFNPFENQSLLYYFYICCKMQPKIDEV